MTNTELLNKAIEESGMKINFIAEKIGLSYFGLSKKINNITEFKASEIAKISDILKLPKEKRDEIFFADKSD